MIQTYQDAILSISNGEREGQEHQIHTHRGKYLHSLLPSVAKAPLTLNVKQQGRGAVEKEYR